MPSTEWLQATLIVVCRGPRYNNELINKILFNKKEYKIIITYNNLAILSSLVN